MMHERTYHSRVLKDDSSDQKGPRRFSWKRFLVITLALGVVVGAVFMIRAPFVQVTTVVVEGAHVADPVEVSDNVLGRLEGAHLYVLPRSSTFLISTKKIERALSELFPRFETVAVERTSFRELTVTVNEYAGAYLWCEHDNDDCLFMDTQGVVFADAPYFSGDAYMRIYSGSRSELPFTALDETQRALMTRSVDQLTALDLEVVSIDFASPRRINIVFSRESGAHASLYIDPTNDIDAAFDALYTGMRVKAFASLYRDPKQTLDYIDLRFANKMVYKFK